MNTHLSQVWDDQYTCGIRGKEGNKLCNQLLRSWTWPLQDNLFIITDVQHSHLTKDLVYCRKLSGERERRRERKGGRKLKKQ
jgi:hypothetical protein